MSTDSPIGLAPVVDAAGRVDLDGLFARLDAGYALRARDAWYERFVRAASPRAPARYVVLVRNTTGGFIAHAFVDRAAARREVERGVALDGTVAYDRVEVLWPSRYREGPPIGGET